MQLWCQFLFYKYRLTLIIWYNLTDLPHFFGGGGGGGSKYCLTVPVFTLKKLPIWFMHLSDKRNLIQPFHLQHGKWNVS
jgi:hypothetical protein